MRVVIGAVLQEKPVRRADGPGVRHIRGGQRIGDVFRRIGDERILPRRDEDAVDVLRRAVMILVRQAVRVGEMRTRAAELLRLVVHARDERRPVAAGGSLRQHVARLVHRGDQRARERVHDRDLLAGAEFEAAPALQVVEDALLDDDHVVRVKTPLLAVLGDEQRRHELRQARRLSPDGGVLRKQDHARFLLHEKRRGSADLDVGSGGRGRQHAGQQEKRDYYGCESYFFHDNSTVMCYNKLNMTRRDRRVRSSEKDFNSYHIQLYGKKQHQSPLYSRFFAVSVEKGSKMKLKWYELLLAALTLAFLCFVAGFVLGRSKGGDAVVITTQYEPSPSPAITLLSDEPSGDTRALPGTDEEPGLVNINTATAEEMASLPGVGDILAERIVEYRGEHGAFATIYDLTAVPGIGEGKLEAMKDRITTEDA